MASRPVAAPANPHKLGDRGAALFDAVSTGRTMSAIDIVNLVEACRLADRLEKFHDLLTGERSEWFLLKLSEDGDEITVEVSDVVNKARLHASTMKTLLAGFEASVGAESEAAPTGEVPSNVANIKEGLTKPTRRAPARQKRSAV